MKKKFLYLIPALALVITGCSLLPKPTSQTSSQTSVSTTSTSEGTSGGGNTSSTETSTSQGGTSQSDVNYGTEDSPLSVSEVLTEAPKIGLADGKISSSLFYAKGKLKAAMTKGTSQEGNIEYAFVIQDDTNEIEVSHALLKEGKTDYNYVAGDDILLRSYIKKQESKTAGYYFTFNPQASVADEKAPRVLSDGSKASPDPTGVSINAESFELRIGGQKQLTATIVPEAAFGEIEWSVNKIGEALEGKVTAEGGLVKVADDARANDEYNIVATIKGTQLSDTAKVKVIENTSTEKTVEFAVSDFETVSGGTAGVAYTLTKSGIKYEAVGGVTDSYLQVFKGKTLKFSGATIVKIELECTTDGDAKYGPGSFGSGAPTGYTFEPAGKKGTWEGELDSVSFTASDNQVRMTKVTVTYLDNGGGTTPVDPTGITVTPTTATVKQGATQAFAAALAPQGATGTITWSVVGKNSADTSKVTLSATTGAQVTATVAADAVVDAVYEIKATTGELNPAVAELTVAAKDTPTPPQPGEFTSVAKYGFENTQNGTAVTDASKVKGWFSKVSGTDIVNSVSNLVAVFAGTEGGSSTTSFKLNNALKIGKGKSPTEGSLTIALSQTVKKVIISGFAQKNTLTFAVNGGDAYTGFQSNIISKENMNPSSASVAEFVITDSNSIVITSTERLIITAIEFLA